MKYKDEFLQKIENLILDEKEEFEFEVFDGTSNIICYVSIVENSCGDSFYIVSAFGGYLPFIIPISVIRPHFDSNFYWGEGNYSDKMFSFISKNLGKFIRFC